MAKELPFIFTLLKHILFLLFFTALMPTVPAITEVQATPDPYTEPLPTAPLPVLSLTWDAPWEQPALLLLVEAEH